MTRALTVAALTLTLLVSAAAQQSRPAEFRYERPVTIQATGAQRLDIDASLLAGGHPFVVTRAGDRAIASGGLSDLRFFTADNRELPYLIIGPPRVAPAWLDAEVLAVAATEKTSGFEADLGQLLEVNAVRFGGIPPPFLKRFMLEASGDRTRWTLLIREGTSFDLPDESLRQTLHRFVPGEYRYFRVTWDDRNSGRVPPPFMFQAQRVSRLAQSEPLRSSLIVERRPSEPGTSRFRLGLPGARMPVVAIELDVAGERIYRSARVLETRFGGVRAEPHVIGRAALRRVVRDGIPAEALQIPIEQPHEAQLDLVVDDGSNGPLELRGASAVYAELPWIYLDAPAGVVTARYGNDGLDAPRYDLEAIRSDVVGVDVPRARWNEPREIVEREVVASTPLPEAGSTVDVAGFGYERALPTGNRALITVPLDAAALAHTVGPQAGFPDVRVVDASGRQIPYVLERRDEPIELMVRLERRDLDLGEHPRSARTSYVVQLPYERLPMARLALRTPASVFQRVVTLGVLRQPGERRREPWLQTLETVTWQKAVEDGPPATLVLNVPEERKGELVLLVEEGDNQQLSIDRSTLLLPSYAVRLFRPNNQALRLMYGREDLAAPQYDLALLASQVLGNVASEVYAGPEQPLAMRARSELVSPPFFWGVLSTATLVLVGLVVRLVRSGTGGSANG